MKLHRFIMAALAAFFSTVVFAQVCEVYQYRWQDRQTNTYQWAMSGSEACHLHATSNAEWFATTYTASYSASRVDSENYTAPNCSYRLANTSRSTGAVTYTGTTVVSIQTRCMDCALGATKAREEWAGWLPATDTSPTWEEFYQPSVGSTVTPKVRAMDYCEYNLMDQLGFIAVGPAVNGWVPYAMNWLGYGQGNPRVPNDTPFVIPPAPEQAPPDPNDSDGDGIPDDEDDDGATPLTCSEPPDFYTEQYPQGIQGVWDNIKNTFLAGSLWSGLTHLVPNFQTSDCPTFTLPSIGEHILGTQDFQLTIPCYVWTAIKALMLLSASFFAFRLIFGGA